MNYEILTAFMLASTALAFSPGPDNIYVLTQSLAYGKKSGLATTVGFAAGCLVHTTLLAFGVSALIAQNDMVYTGIKVFGALYLLYLAYTVYKENPSLEIGDETTARKSLWQLFRQGFIMNVLNPKVTIFFLAFFPGFLFSNNLSHVTQFFVLGSLFILVTLVVFGLIALLSGSISNVLKRQSKIAVFLKWLQIVVFVGIAVYLLLSDK